MTGSFAGFSGGTTPRDFSPCGICLDQRKTILVRQPERAYPYLSETGIPICEALLVPLFIAGADPLGTLWVMAHDEKSKFTGTDARAMTDLAAFADLALRMVRDAKKHRATEESWHEALEHQEMLTREMGHRVKNLLAIALGMVRISAKSGGTAREMATSLSGRLEALAKAHALLRPNPGSHAEIIREATVGGLVEAILRPYEGPKTVEGGTRTQVDPPFK